MIAKRSASRRALYFLPTRALALANRVLHHIQGLSVGNCTSLEDPPVFILGAPRCGSTLACQVLLDAFDFGYLSNLHALCYGMPELVERVACPGRWRRPNCRVSEYGRTEGWSGPSECGNFWYRFFPRTQSAKRLAPLPPRKLRALRRAVAGFVRSCGRPVLFKNLFCSIRIPQLAQALPEALFLVVHRDEIDVGHSLLEGRQRLFGDYRSWLGVLPPGGEALSELPAHAQVIEQVRGIYALIDRERCRVGPDRFFDVRYERFCDRPNEVLDELEDFFRRHGVPLRRQRMIFERFERRNEVRIDQDLYQSMCDYASKSKAA